MYPFAGVVGWFLHGILQRVLVWIPLVNPIAENRLSPPAWWYECWWWSYWYYNVDENGHPNETWCSAYLQCVLTLLKNSILSKANEQVVYIRDLLLGKIGFINWAYDSLGAWLNGVSNKLGWILPWWATTAIDGLWKLWGWCPSGIRSWSQTWDQIWENIKRAVRDWAQARYEDARRLAFNTWNWWVGTGQQIEQWWRNYANWLGNLAGRPYAVLSQTLGSAWNFLVDFWQNPSQRVISWLGPTWQQLYAFARDCLRFWYNLWGTYASVLVELLDDPLEFFWQRAEHFLLRKLE